MAVMRNPPYHGYLFLHNGKFPWCAKVEEGSHANCGGRHHLDQFPSLSGHHPGHEATNHAGRGTLLTNFKEKSADWVQHSHASSPRREHSLYWLSGAAVLCVEVQGHHIRACARASITTVHKFTIKARHHSASWVEKLCLILKDNTIQRNYKPTFAEHRCGGLP